MKKTSADFLLRFIVSDVLGLLLNPRLHVQFLRLSAGQVIATWRALRANKHWRAPIIVQPPFVGSWVVANGGITRTQSHSWFVINQRFAYDFVKETSEGDHPKQHEAFGEVVVAPARGVVVEASDEARDMRLATNGWTDWRTSDVRGNWVTIKHEAEVYSVLAHLRHGMVMVRPGQSVKPGDEIGRCGNSGHSTEPHIHFHVQSHSSFYLGIGLPVAFHRCRIGDGGEVGPAPTNAGPFFIHEGQRVTFEPQTEAPPRNLEGMRVLQPSDLWYSILLFAIAMLFEIGFVTFWVWLVGSVAGTALRDW